MDNGNYCVRISRIAPFSNRVCSRGGPKLPKVNRAFSKSMIKHGMFVDSTLGAATRSVHRQEVLSRRCRMSMDRLTVNFEKQVDIVARMQYKLRGMQEGMLKIVQREKAAVDLQRTYRGYLSRKVSGGYPNSYIARRTARTRARRVRREAAKMQAQEQMRWYSTPTIAEDAENEDGLLRVAAEGEVVAGGVRSGSTIYLDDGHLEVNGLSNGGDEDYGASGEGNSECLEDSSGNYDTDFEEYCCHPDTERSFSNPLPDQNIIGQFGEKSLCTVSKHNGEMKTIARTAAAEIPQNIIQIGVHTATETVPSGGLDGYITLPSGWGTSSQDFTELEAGSMPAEDKVNGSIEDEESVFEEYCVSASRPSMHSISNVATETELTVLETPKPEGLKPSFSSSRIGSNSRKEYQQEHHRVESPDRHGCIEVHQQQFDDRSRVVPLQDAADSHPPDAVHAMSTVKQSTPESVNLDSHNSSDLTDDEGGDLEEYGSEFDSYEGCSSTSSLKAYSYRPSILPPNVPKPSSFSPRKKP